MAFLQKLFNSSKLRRQNNSKSSYNDTRQDWKKPQFDDKSIRLVLFYDSNSTSGRKLIFDSNSVVRENEKVSRWTKCQQASKLHKVSEGQTQQNVSGQKYKYQHKASTDSKMLEEIMFGAEGMAYKGTSLKVHVTRTQPGHPKLMLTKVFVPEKTKRSSAIDKEEPTSFSSIPNLGIASKSSTLDSKGSGSYGQSVPVDVPVVPSPKHHLLDDDSGLASLTSSGSFYAASPSSLSDSCNSLNMEKRLNRCLWTSLENGLERRRSNHDVLSELTSPRNGNKGKFALAIIFDTSEEQNASRLFESFFFSHIALFESHLEQLRHNIFANRTHVVETFEEFKCDIIDLYTAPRLCEPVWLNMMSYTSYRYMLCEKFLKEFVSLVNKFDGKSNNFFMSTLITAVLTHHLAWVPTVMPAGGSPSRTYLDKHSAKWVDTLAKSHPYNPLWAQLGDLYGAIGFPLKLSRTVIVGKKADIVKKILFILSYFIRCSDILETSEIGSLETFLEKLDFSTMESPTSDSASAKNASVYTPVNDEETQLLTSSPTPVNSTSEHFRFDKHQTQRVGDQPQRPRSQHEPKSFETLPLDSLLSDKRSSSAQGMDYNSNSQQNTASKQSCQACDSNRDAANKYGKSTFYVSNEPCSCVKGLNSVEPLSISSFESDRRSEIQKRKEKLNLRLKLPSVESRCHGNSTSNSTCKLSTVEIVEQTKVEKAGLNRNCVSALRKSDPIGSDKIKGYEIKIPHNASKVMTHEEMKKLFQKKGSNSMFNEYYVDGSEVKTIDDLDEKDRIVDLHGGHQRLRYLSGDNLQSGCSGDEDACKTPSMPDLTLALGDLDSEQSYRSRLKSMDKSYKYRKASLSRQMSDSSSKLAKNVPGRCRPVTPTEYGKRRHVSSTGSFDIDFQDPRTYCQELQMPCMDQDTSCSSQKDFDKNFGRSLLADFSDHYMSDFVLHGTSDKTYREKLIRDIRMTMQYSVLDEPIAEAVVVVADTDNFTVNMYSSQHIDRANSCPQTCQPSGLVSNLIKSVVDMANLKMSPEFCMMHLEDRLQETYFKSKMMAEYLKKNNNVQDLLAMFGFERSDLPLLVAIAGTHTPNFAPLCIEVNRRE